MMLIWIENPSNIFVESADVSCNSAASLIRKMPEGKIIFHLVPIGLLRGTSYYKVSFIFDEIYSNQRIMLLRCIMISSYILVTPVFAQSS